MTSPRTFVRQGWMPLVSGDGRHVEIVSAVPIADSTARFVRQDTGADAVSVTRVTLAEFDATIARECRAELLHEIAESLAEAQPSRSARSGLTRGQLLAPPVVLVLVAACLVVDVRLTTIVLLAVTSLTLSLFMGFRLVCVLLLPLRRLFQRRSEAPAERSDPQRTEDSWVTNGTLDTRGSEDLPTYTILVPAFREAKIIGRLIENLEQLDYPRDRMEVLVLLEEDDTSTIVAALAADPPAYMRILVVPRGAPQTKPRACNYGLIFARGEFLVIYDAEDRPEPDQLRRVVADFRRAAVERQQGRTLAQLACVQCGLSYYNAPYNVLTRLFAIEYSFLFDAMLRGLDGSGIPIPLGGTSNHFDTLILRRLGGWDPYNVTEDADLGIRAAAMGYRVGVNTSTTWEEACSRSGAFIKQRTRWIKGYLLTSAVNLRHPVQFTRATGLRGLVCLLALILGTPLAFLVYPVLVVFAALTIAGEQWGFLGMPHWLATLGLVNMLAGTGLTIVTSAIVALPRYGWRIAGLAIFSPVYWLLHSVAAWRAAWQTMLTPHVWEKTPHGLSDDFDPEQELGQTDRTTGQPVGRPAPVTARP